MAIKIAAIISYDQKPLATLQTGSEITLLTKGTQAGGDISIDVLPGLETEPANWSGNCKIEQIEQTE